MCSAFIHLSVRVMAVTQLSGNSSRVATPAEYAIHSASTCETSSDIEYSETC